MIVAAIGGGGRVGASGGPGDSAGVAGDEFTSTQVTVVGPETAHVTVPVGVTPGGPATVAVNVKLPPVTTPATLEVTVVVDAALPTTAVVSEPEPSRRN